MSRVSLQDFQFSLINWSVHIRTSLIYDLWKERENSFEVHRINSTYVDLKRFSSKRSCRTFISWSVTRNSSISCVPCAESLSISSCKLVVADVSDPIVCPDSETIKGRRIRCLLLNEVFTKRRRSRDIMSWRSVTETPRNFLMSHWDDILRTPTITDPWQTSLSKYYRWNWFSAWSLLVCPPSSSSFLVCGPPCAVDSLLPSHLLCFGCPEAQVLQNDGNEYVFSVV